MSKKRVSLDLSTSECEKILDMISDYKWSASASADLASIEDKIYAALGRKKPEPKVKARSDDLLWDGPKVDPNICHASRGDGECFWRRCPQLRDGEPEKSHRHCPLDTQEDEDM